MDKKELGDLGENLAVGFLVKLGFTIIIRNYRTLYGEIDIIARSRSNETLVFAEVKLRTNNRFGLPAEAVTINKQKRIISAATQFISEINEPECSFRFDVIEVYIKNKEYKINHIKNAFWG